MTYSIIDRLRFENQQTDKLKQQEKLRQEKYQIESKPTDKNHILSCSMSDALRQVRKDKSTIINDMYIFPDNKK